MAQTTDPKAAAAAYLDETRARLAFTRLSHYDDRKLSTLKGKELEGIAEAVTDLIGPIFRERDRRAQTPRGKAGLRLVAEKGELTAAGRRHVSALKGVATRRAARSVAR